LWNYKTGNEVHSSPSITEGFVYIGSDDGYVHRLEISTGRLSWKSPVGGLVRSSPAVVAGHIYIGSGEHDVFCLNASNGYVIWRFPTSSRVQSSPAVSNGAIYVASDDFFVYAINASTGSQIWRCHTGSLASSPCIYNNVVFVGSTDGYLCALNASRGTMIWQYRTDGSISSSPAASYGCVYVGSDDNSIYCLNATNGKKIWQSPTGFWVRSSAAVTNGKIYTGSEDFNIYCLDAFTGSKKGSYELGGSVYSSPAIAESRLYVGSSDFCVYALGLANSTFDSSPFHSTSSTPWTTVAFDCIAVVVFAATIWAILSHFHSAILDKQTVENSDLRGRKNQWVKSHANLLFVVTILAFSTVFFFDLTKESLWVADEQVYAEWAFHMFKTGDYLTPWAFGQLEVWVAKPPLFMWLMSLSYQIFGANSFSARLWSPVFGALSLIFLFFLGKNLYNSAVGFFAALLLGTFATFYSFARHAMTDVAFVFFLLGSLYFLLLSEKTEQRSRFLALGGFFFGLAFMTKQLLALLIPLIIFVYFIFTHRGLKFFFTKYFAVFWRVAILVASPWLIYMTLRFGPDFWQSHFVFSGIMRAVTPLEGHSGDNFFYFTYLLNNENLFWLALLPFSAGLCVFNALKKGSSQDKLILVWMLAVIAIFTLIQTKLFWYILPALPAFALAIGSLLFQLLKKIKPLLLFVVRRMSLKRRALLD
jgi:outer membrane protein assembly factor BamB